ncbi:MAG: hypothetical protein A3I61_17265 [Acidobacteria bacterium RIFCSPLOWO2_02_FULL_68_18]|nr:MAG: hypothetical protein A3I61_17265 [Acidobacteria bacterium RIFCSPLOWO2_02_FULL_68_18]OFW50429.1 MAG: hypothetical protein A3G77_11840 [Acidobacteria bacterium RIFCSPLOWO2_12_FULL_68_19]
MAWWLLLLPPPGLFAYVLSPGLGNYSEGFWPEWFGASLLGTDGYRLFAATLRLWTIGLLVAAAVVAFAARFWLAYRWRKRLRSFQVSQVLRFKGLVYRDLGLVFIASGTLATTAILLGQDLRDVPVVGWVVIVSAIAAFGAVEFFMAVLAFGSTNTLLRGR